MLPNHPLQDPAYTARAQSEAVHWQAVSGQSAFAQDAAQSNGVAKFLQAGVATRGSNHALM